MPVDTWAAPHHASLTRCCDRRVLAQWQPGTDHLPLPSQPPPCRQSWTPGVTPLDCFASLQCPWWWAGRRGPRRQQLVQRTESWVLGSTCVTTKSGFELPECLFSIYKVWGEVCRPSGTPSGAPCWAIPAASKAVSGTPTLCP